MNRCPLHVAVGTRASLQVIEILVHAFPEACTIQDCDLKTALHLACDRSCELFEDDSESTTSKPPNYEVVRTLIKSSFASVPLEDFDGMSALEHAIFSDAPIEIIKTLQYITRKQSEKEHKRRRVSLEQEPPSHAE